MNGGGGWQHCDHMGSGLRFGGWTGIRLNAGNGGGESGQPLPPPLPSPYPILPLDFSQAETYPCVLKRGWQGGPERIRSGFLRIRKKFENLRMDSKTPRVLPISVRNGSPEAVLVPGRMRTPRPRSPGRYPSNTQASSQTPMGVCGGGGDGGLWSQPSLKPWAPGRGHYMTLWLTLL